MPPRSRRNPPDVHMAAIKDMHATIRDLVYIQTEEQRRIDALEAKLAAMQDSIIRLSDAARTIIRFGLHNAFTNTA